MDASRREQSNRQMQRRHKNRGAKQLQPHMAVWRGTTIQTSSVRTLEGLRNGNSLVRLPSKGEQHYVEHFVL